MTHPLVHTIELNKVYRGRASPVHAVSNVSISINAGEFVAICGRSGSGKSSLLYLLGLLAEPDSGLVRTERPRRFLAQGDEPSGDPMRFDRIRFSIAGSLAAFAWAAAVAVLAAVVAALPVLLWPLSRAPAALLREAL